MALYRKYRPATFAEVVGQEHVTDPLSTALDTGRISHAYLFSGPRGCGKTSSARILARSLNCVEGPTSRPCGVCASCVALGPGGAGNLDVIELDAASHGGVDDTRELRDRAFYAPAESRYRVFIVDEAHMVTTAGFNALLKIVEEPPAHLIFIFATTEPDKVLPTIRSRTHHYPFRLLPPATMRGLLGKICEQESVPVEEAVYPLVIRAGGGSPRDSLSVLDQLLAGAGPDGVTYPRAVALLGVTDIALIDNAIDALAADDGAALFGTIDSVVEAGHDPRRFAVDLLERLRDLILLRAVPDAADRGLVSGPGDVLERLRDQAERLGPATLTRYAELLHDGLGEMRGATAPRLLLEVICARMLLPSVSDTESATLQRLERLERGLASGTIPPTARPSTGEPPSATPTQPTDQPSPTPPAAGSRRRGAELLAAARAEKEAATGTPKASTPPPPPSTPTPPAAPATSPSSAPASPAVDPASSSSVPASPAAAPAPPLSAPVSPASDPTPAPSAPTRPAAAPTSPSSAPTSPVAASTPPSSAPASPVAAPTSSPSAPTTAATESSAPVPSGPAASGPADSAPAEPATTASVANSASTTPESAATTPAPEPASRPSAADEPTAPPVPEPSAPAPSEPLGSPRQQSGVPSETGAGQPVPDAPLTGTAAAATTHSAPEAPEAPHSAQQPHAQAVPQPASASREQPAPRPASAPQPQHPVPASESHSAPQAQRAPEHAEPEVAAPAEDLIAVVDAAWPDIKAKVREFGPTLQALLSGAAVSRVDGDVIVFAHQSPPLAQRLSDQRNIDAVRSAVRAVLGRELGVRWETGAPAPRPAPQAKAAAPRGAAGENKPAARPKFSRPSQAKGGSSGAARPADDDIPPPDFPDLPDDPGPEDGYGTQSPRSGGDSGRAEAALAPPTPEEEQEMLAAAAVPVAPGDRQDPDEVALALLRNELGAKSLDG
ncbi:DNA polymerase III subunit gamma and tau [Nocardia sp. AG03]|uniref:DNA polymerase III subunit gamma and tau n=1 Tax=Nocardia sp. AG03 TaxID=3025312 RepID=UPI0024185D9D|nr:DNA polymerase III subunit gamma and tau [Nocardia sp. AG03]